MSSLAELPELIGFFSYSRQDDVDSLGALSDLRDRIYRELSMRLGRDQRDFRLWQDKAAIPFGALWKDEITRAIQESAFFIPIVSPRTVRSEHCKFEFEAFLDREKALGRDNLVFPILYIEVPGLDRQGLQSGNDVLRIVNDRQFADWRAIRHLDVGSVEIKQRIEHFCRNVVEALERTSPRQRPVAPLHDATGYRQSAGSAARDTSVIDDVTSLIEDDAAGKRRPTEERRHPRNASGPWTFVGWSWHHPLVAVPGLVVVCAGLIAALVFKAGQPAGSSAPGVAEQKSPPPARPAVASPIYHAPARQTLAVDGGFPVGVGDTAADVQRAFATSKTPVSMNGTSTEKTMIRLEQLGIWFFFDSQGKIYTVRFDSPWSGSVQGIAIGDTKSTIEAKLGKPNGTDGASHGSGSYYYDDRYVYRRAGTFISIYFFDAADRVKTIMVP